MDKRLKRKNVKEWVSNLLIMMEVGNSIEEFLAFYQISKRDWDKYVKKNKSLQKAVEDGEVYYKAYFMRQMKEKAMFGLAGYGSLAKLFFEHSLGLTEEARKSKDKKKQKKNYKVIYNLNPPEPKENEE